MVSLQKSNIISLSLYLKFLLTIHHICSVMTHRFPSQNSLKDLDPSYKMDLDLEIVLGEKFHVVAELCRPNLHISGNFGKASD